VPRFSYGDIVYAWFSDGHGRSKLTPALVISGDEYNHAGEPLQLLAISTTPDHDSPPYHILIPPSDHHRLEAGSQVKCNWATDVEQSKVSRNLGFLDDETLEKAVAWFDRLMEDDTFDDWQ
jgi:mRNA-degrading endonuclease toxin of MazEF toxin-antitoxin module